MILRPLRDGGAIAISQPAHAWIAGQMARAWGGAIAGVDRLDDTLILAIEQHDIGWLAIERAPVLNPATGWPHDFLSLPRWQHTALWSEGVATAEAAYGPHVALLISLHGVAVYALTPDEARPPEDLALVQRFREEQAAVQERLRSRLDVGNEVLVEQQRLLFALDLLSLVACGAFGSGRRRAPPVLLAGGETRLALCLDPAMTRLTIDPWPFRGQAFEVGCPARRLPSRRFDDEAALRAAIASAETLTVQVLLTPAQGSGDTAG